jgi:hypothetical protein
MVYKTSSSFKWQPIPEKVLILRRISGKANDFVVIMILKINEMSTSLESGLLIPSDGSYA